MSPPSTGTLRIALVGDLHTFSLAIWPWELLGKTLAGQVNLWLNRSRKFHRDLLAPTIARIHECRPDLALFTGDLTTTSRPREFRFMRQALAPLIDECTSVIVAGNHDRYTFTAKRRRRLERTFPRFAPEVFPAVHSLIGGWRLIAVDSAVPRLFDSRGVIGPRQLQHMQSLLKSVGDDEGVLLLCHYPFGKPPQLPPMKPGHRLIDEQAWCDTIAECRGRVIIAHGHVHCPWLWRPDMRSIGSTGDAARVLDINAGAPTLAAGGWPRGQGFWTLDLQADPSRPIALAHHVMGAGEAPVGDADKSAAPVEVPAHPDWKVRAFTIAI